MFLRTQIEVVGRGRALHGGRSVLAVLAAAIGIMALAASPAVAAPGGSSGGTSTPGAGPQGEAKLVDGQAIAPTDAPSRVIRAIEAANEIVKGRDYCLGGGHGKWKSRCYDCSGTVSYALHGARILDSPMPSGSFTKWGDKGKGKWITVYANGGHMYAVIAGLRLDTSMTDGKGPGWSDEMRSKRGYKVRHWKNL